MRIASCAAAVLALALPAAPATASERFGSSVTINVHGKDIGVPDYLHGRVRSAKPACERGRKVRVIRRNEGTTTVYGRALTDRQGRWRFDPQGTVPNGTYRALARSQRIDAGRCAGARSRSVFVD